MRTFPVFAFIVLTCVVLTCAAFLASAAEAQQPPAAAQPADKTAPNNTSSDSGLKDFFEAKIKLEWDAFKNKDKNAYADLLADDYQGVEVDGRGERNKIQAVNELAEQNVFNYSLWGYKFIALGADAAFVIYESTIQFPPKAQIRYSRVYITELWVKRGGQWKELHYQETHVK